MPEINNEEHNGLILIRVLNQCGRRVLYDTFRWGTPQKPTNMTLYDYLKASGKPAKFDQTQLAVIHKSPDGSEFDVSLLYKGIKQACENVAHFNDKKWLSEGSHLEYYVTAIKNMRNQVFHGQLAINDKDFIEKTNMLKKLLIGCLKTSGERFGRNKAEVDEEMKHVYDDLNRIMQETLADENLILFCSDKIKQLMINNSRETLKNVFQNIVYINPVSFITNNLRLEVDKIFVDIEIKQGKCRGEGEHVDYRDLLQLVQNPESPPSTSNASQQQSPESPPSTSNASQQQSPESPPSTSNASQQQTPESPPSTSNASQQQSPDALSSPSIASQHENADTPRSTSAASQQQDPPTRPQILLLEGLAGSGKTTLVSMVAQEWINNGQGKIKGLDNYDLMLLVQCRDPTILSYEDLLNKLMPDVSLKFKKLLPRLMKLCKLLIIVDGLDEINQNSRKLIESLLSNFKNICHTNFLFTSRPENLEMFRMKIPVEYGVTNAELRGIPEQRMVEFMCLSHKAIQKQTQSRRSTKQLVKEVKKLKGFQEHFALPMNLILITFLWDQATEELNLMTVTQTELYEKIHRLSCKKILERLANHEKTNHMAKDDLENGIQVVLREIYWIALKSLSRDQLIIEKEMIDKVKLVCESQGLPKEELLSAFLSLKPTWTWEGVQERYSAPHKGIQDYYSAVHIVTTLKCQLQSPALSVSYNQLSKPPAMSSLPCATPALPTPASPTPASPTPTSPTAASPTPALPTPAPTKPSLSRRTSLSLASLIPASPLPALSSSMRGKLKSVVKKVKNRLQLSARPGATQGSSVPTSATPDSPVSATHNTIREVLKQSIKPAEVDMTKYQNVLVHVAGLLPLVLHQMPEAPAQEVVALLQESGMTHEDHWLGLLENTKVAPITAKAVATFIEINGGIHINDSRVGSYAALLPHIQRSKVYITLNSDPTDLPHLPDLLTSLTRHRCIQLVLNHHYYHHADITTTSDDLLHRVQPRDDMLEFTGRVSGVGVALLPASLTRLRLAVVSDDHARCLLPQLHAAVSSRLPQLEYLKVTVAAGVSPAQLVPLPEVKTLNLELCGVSDAGVSDAGVSDAGVSDAGVSDAGVSYACDVAMALQPSQGFWEMEFPGATLREASWRDLVLGLRRRRVKLQVFRVPADVPLTPHHDDQMRTLVRETLKCDYDRSEKLLNWISTFRG